MKGILVCDIDDTLIRTDRDTIAVYKIKDGKKTRLSTEEFALDKDKDDPTVRYDISEFEDPKKIRDSILKGSIIKGNIEIVNFYLEKDYDFCFLTARSCESVIKETMSDWIDIKDESGLLSKIKTKFKRALSYAISDEKYCEIFDGLTHAQAKGEVIKKIAKLYDEVIFLDDDTRNILAVKLLRLQNVKVIKALKEDKNETRTII